MKPFAQVILCHNILSCCYTRIVSGTVWWFAMESHYLSMIWLNSDYSLYFKITKSKTVVKVGVISKHKQRQVSSSPSRRCSSRSSWASSWKTSWSGSCCCTRDPADAGLVRDADRWYLNPGPTLTKLSTVFATCHHDRNQNDLFQ